MSVMNGVVAFGTTNRGLGRWHPAVPISQYSPPTKHPCTMYQLTLNCKGLKCDIMSTDCDRALHSF